MMVKRVSASDGTMLMVLVGWCAFVVETEGIEEGSERRRSRIRGREFDKEQHIVSRYGGLVCCSIFYMLVSVQVWEMIECLCVCVCEGRERESCEEVIEVIGGVVI